MKDLKRFVDRNIAPLLLLCFCGIMAAFLSVRTNSFFSVKNAVNILEANSYRMLIAVGMMCIISSGAIALSVGSMLSFSAICMAKALKAELPVGLCVGVALLMGASMGALNGVLMHVTRINAFIITLATSYMYRGLSLIATQGIPITKLPQAFRDFGCGDIFGMESGVTMALMAEYLGFEFADAKDWLFFGYDGKVDFHKTNDALRKIISETPKVVIPGFYGAMPDGSIRTFSRGGSDITGAVVAGISITGPAVRMRDETLATLRKPLHDAAVQISRSIGWES